MQPGIMRNANTFGNTSRDTYRGYISVSYTSDKDSSVLILDSNPVEQMTGFFNAIYFRTDTTELNFREAKPGNRLKLKG